MKRNNIYTALLSLSLLGLGACSLDLEPLTSPSVSYTHLTLPTN